MSAADRQLRLAYIIGTYPSLTTTFIDREIRMLRSLGVQLQIVSVRRPRLDIAPEQHELQRGVRYLLPPAVPAVVAAHLRFALVRPLAYIATLIYLLTRRHSSPRVWVMTLIHFGMGVYAANMLRREPPDQIHAHFVDRSATLAFVASRLLGIPYSVTAHANDIYVAPVLLPEKLAGARFVVTCTGYNRAHLARIGGPSLEPRLRCIYHGLELARYRPNGGPPSGTPVVLAVGQLKEKKGFADLLEAIALLRGRGLDVACRIVGDGPLRPQLEARIRRLGLDGAVTLSGALPHAQVIAAYHAATVFALPCVTGGDGDRDGIPNVILEAMAMGLPVVSTDHSGIPEVVRDNITGLLVPPADPAALAAAISRLLLDPGLRHAIGARARVAVAEHFDAERNVRLLLDEFVR